MHINVYIISKEMNILCDNEYMKIQKIYKKGSHGKALYSKKKK